MSFQVPLFIGDWILATVHYVCALWNILPQITDAANQKLPAVTNYSERKITLQITEEAEEPLPVTI
jgi:hypothetical protein